MDCGGAFRVFVLHTHCQDKQFVFFVWQHLIGRLQVEEPSSGRISPIRPSNKASLSPLNTNARNINNRVRTVFSDAWAKALTTLSFDRNRFGPDSADKYKSRLLTLL